jgi:hypothetical protein
MLQTLNPIQQLITAAFDNCWLSKKGLGLKTKLLLNGILIPAQHWFIPYHSTKKLNQMT